MAVFFSYHPMLDDKSLCHYQTHAYLRDHYLDSHMTIRATSKFAFRFVAGEFERARQGGLFFPYSNRNREMGIEMAWCACPDTA